MNMKSIATAAAFALFCAAAQESLAAGPSAPPPPDGVRAGAKTPGGSEPQQKRRKRRPLTQQEQMEKFGGFVEPKYSGRYLYFVDSQGRVPVEAVAWVASQVRIALSLPTRVERGAASTGPGATPPEAGGTIFAVDAEGEPALLVAPDDGWARVNVAALAADNASAEVLEARFKKELWRAFVMLFGGGNSLNEWDVMRPIRSAKDLDASEAVVSSPEPFNVMLAGAKTAGIVPVHRTTYLNAVRLGWAPAPTNEFQKAIWDKVKSDKERGPTNPITIPPPKK